MVEGGGVGLGAEDAFVSVVRRVSWGGKGRGGVLQGVTENAEGEDCYGEEVAGSEGVAVEEAGERFVVVFWGV